MPTNDQLLELEKLQTLSDLNHEILSRQRYLKEQEALIEKLVEEGNLALRSLQLQIEALEEDKEIILAEIQVLNFDKVKLVDEILVLRSELMT